MSIARHRAVRIDCAICGRKAVHQREFLRGMPLPYCANCVRPDAHTFPLPVIGQAGAEMLYAINRLPGMSIVEAARGMGTHVSAPAAWQVASRLLGTGLAVNAAVDRGGVELHLSGKGQRWLILIWGR